MYELYSVNYLKALDIITILGPGILWMSVNRVPDPLSGWHRLVPRIYQIQHDAVDE